MVISSVHFLLTSFCTLVEIMIHFDTIYWFIMVIERKRERKWTYMKVNRNKLNLAQAYACLSNGELAEKAEVPLNTLNNVRAGKVNPLPKTVGKLARALGVPVEDIVDPLGAA